MRIRSDAGSRCTTLVIACAAACLAVGASAADLPKRKAGLWEIDVRMEGMPSMGPMQQCIDQNTDNIMQQRAKDNKQDCSVIDAKPMGNKVTIHSVCKIEGSTATTDGVFEGSFDSGYKGTMKTRYSPPCTACRIEPDPAGALARPMQAGSETGRRCHAEHGRHGAGWLNINDMMKDPKIQK